MSPALRQDSSNNTPSGSDFGKTPWMKQMKYALRAANKFSGGGDTLLRAPLAFLPDVRFFYLKSKHTDSVKVKRPPSLTVSFTASPPRIDTLGGFRSRFVKNALSQNE